jgi:ribosome recycling factor
VDYYGTATPLKSLATISAPEARLLVVQPFDPGAIDEIERGIMKADLGVSPNSDGKLIRVPIPELTEERRREYVKAVKKLAEERKVSVRNGRRDALALLKDMEKSKEIAEDESRRGQKQVQDMTDEHTNQIDQLLAAKEQEILTI